MFDWSKSDAIVLGVAILIIAVITTILTLTIRNSSEKIRKIPLHVITALIILLEVIRQVLYLTKQYDCSVIPLQFYNIVLLTFPFMIWGKGKLASIGNAMSIAVVSVCMLCLYLSPSGVLGSGTTASLFSNFDSFYLVMYYNLSILFFTISFALRLFDYDMSAIVYIWVGLLIYSSIILVVSYWVEAFFINPMEIVSELETLRVKFGMIIYSVVMFLLTCGIGGILFIIERGLYSCIKKKY